MPKPFQKPHPPLRYAATSRETYSAMGTMGMPIFVGIGRSTIADLGAGYIRVPAGMEASGTSR